MRKLVGWSIAAASFGLVSCHAHARMSRVKTEFVDVTFSALDFSRGADSTTISGKYIEIKAKDSRPICDVSIEIIEDSNRNGDIGDEGDQRKTISYWHGKLEKQKSASFRISAAGEVQQAYVLIRGRPCDEKERIVLGSFGITQRGASPLSGGGLGLAVATASSKPHFVEMRTDATHRSMTIVAGDLRATRSSLRGIYESETGLSGDPDFVGALVFVDGHLITWILGPGIGRARLPRFPRGMRSLQIVTFDSDLRIVGNWELADVK